MPFYPGKWSKKDGLVQIWTFFPKIFLFRLSGCHFSTFAIGLIDVFQADFSSENSFRQRKSKICRHTLEMSFSSLSVFLFWKKILEVFMKWKGNTGVPSSYKGKFHLAKYWLGSFVTVEQDETWYKNRKKSFTYPPNYKSLKTGLSFMAKEYLKGA